MEENKTEFTYFRNMLLKGTYVNELRSGKGKSISLLFIGKDEDGEEVRKYKNFYFTDGAKKYAKEEMVKLIKNFAPEMGITDETTGKIEEWKTRLSNALSDRLITISEKPQDGNSGFVNTYVLKQDNNKKEDIETALEETEGEQVALSDVPF